jgi:predicted ferric reductase
MKKNASQAVTWAALYVILAALPLGLALLAPLPPARGFWIEFGVGLGFVGLAMLGLQFALTARFRQIAAPFGLDIMLHFHRQAGLVAFGMVLAHPVILILASPGYLEFLDPRASFVRALALWAVLGSLVLLIGLTLGRRSLGLAYEWWLASHGVLALSAVFIGLVHVLRVGYYIAVPWKQVAWIGMSGAAILLLLYSRVLKPLRLRRTPYRVAEVRPERGRSWTVALEPEGHPGMRFLPGQFAWVTFGDSPFSLEQHPFSFSSSARRPDRLEFTIKELGNFTDTVGTLQPGTRAFVEGPHGAFTLPDDATGAVFVAGGVGITPVMSILRTMRDAGDRRPLLLVYGHSREENITFREELQDLERELDLRVVHVLAHPPQQWGGETGLVDEALLDRHLPTMARSGVEYFVCGPEPMMDVVESHLLRQGVSLWKLNSERFEIA